MTPLLSVAELAGMLSRRAVLPLDPESNAGELDEPRILEALKVATGVIVTHLPWLLDAETGRSRCLCPLSLRTPCGCLCRHRHARLTDAVTSKEDTLAAQKTSVALLQTIAKERQGGLLGPEYQAAEIVEPNEAEGISDSRFFKKGGLI